jgi:putative Flp pilus-assembly TadE/G-like protein/von Willebrand factor type A domain-containing protein
VSRAIKRVRVRAEETGQTIVLVVIALVSLLGMTGFAIDVGYAYYTHRSLQASADAAALAGAQNLPDASTSITVARQFGTSSTGKNKQANLESITESISTKCISSIPGCKPVNAVVVDEKTRSKTFFSKVLGIDGFDVHVRSTACSPCGTKPFDVVLVLDRTGSMCQDHNGNSDPGCSDLNNAKAGMRAFLGGLDSQSTMVGLTVFPPATSVGNRCSTPSSSNQYAYDQSNAAYTVVPLSRGYTDKGGKLITSTPLVSTINCVKGGGTTAYANAVEAAQKELDNNGRPDVTNIIVFFSDGAANTGPAYYSTNSPYRKQPCHQGVTSSSASKSNGTIVYVIGYDLDANNGGANKCTSYTGANESPSITAYSALSQMASDSKKFYEKTSPGDLTNIFEDISGDLMFGSSALIDNDAT